MSESTAQTAVPRPKHRFRIGMRGLMGGVLLLGLVFGWIARTERQAVEREALVAKLSHRGIYFVHREPTLLCLVLAKVAGARSILPDTPALFSKWISPGWLSRPVAFNAGRLRPESAPPVIAELRLLGDVHEVRFPSGLTLFYLNKVRYSDLARERATCTFKVYSAAGTFRGS